MLHSRARVSAPLIRLVAFWSQRGQDCSSQVVAARNGALQPRSGNNARLLD